MIFYEGKSVTISWNDQAQCVVSELKGFAEGDEYREALDKGLELLKLKRSKRWMGDMRLGSLMSVDDAKWVQEDWRPRAVKDGLKKTALLVTTNALGKMQIDRITRTVEQIEGRKIETAYFDDPVKARLWLQGLG